MSSVPTLGYWDIRGFGEPIRLLLQYCGVKYNDKRYPFGPGNGLSDQQSIKQYWRSGDMNNLGLDFPNLPYYIEADLKLTQSITIMRYLGRKYGLIGTDERTLARQELAEQQLIDMRSLLLQVIDANDYEERKVTYIGETLPTQLESFAKFLGSNKWLTQELSYTDFLAYETLEWFRLFSTQTFEKFPTLLQYLKRFESLKPIKEYINCSEYKSRPFYGPIHKWGSIQ